MIWCVDHDAQRRNMEIHALRCVGMDAKGYDSADSFWKDLQKECPELILMDAALPGLDPLALIKRIRQSSVAGSVPVIMQTLRKKLGTCGSLIESVKYIGYRMKKVP